MALAKGLFRGMDGRNRGSAVEARIGIYLNEGDCGDWQITAPPKKSGKPREVIDAARTGRSLLIRQLSHAVFEETGARR